MGCNAECSDAGGNGGMDSGAHPGDLCDASSVTKCPGGTLTCVPPPDPFSGTCMLPCQSTEDCVNGGLHADACCLLSDPQISVCVPLAYVPIGSVCD